MIDPFAPRVEAVPGHAGVYVRTVTAAELADVAAAFADGLSNADAAMHLCHLCACDEQGARRFPNGDLDVVRLAPGFLVQAVATQAAAVNGLGDEAVEDAAGNSEADQ